MKKFYLFLTFALLCISSFAFDTKTYYAKCTVNSTGNGLVYASTKNSAEGEYAQESSANGSAQSAGNGASISFYRFAQPETGYKFAGWYTNEECTEGLTFSSLVGIDSNSQDNTAPAAKNYWAKFIEGNVSVDAIPMAAIGDAEKMVLLNEDAEVAVEHADRIDVNIASYVVKVSYVIREMMELTDEEGTRWILADTLDYSDEININTHAYAALSFDLYFEKDSKYMVIINAADKDDNKWSVNYVICNSTPEPTPTSYEPKYSAFVADGTTEFYLYNVESKSFVKGGNDWGTRASGFRNEGNLFRFTDNGNGTFTFADKIGEDWQAMFTDNQAASIWVDNAGRAESKTWTVTSLPDGTYRIGNTAVSSIENAVLSVSPYLSDNRLYFFTEGAETMGQTWAFVTPEDFNDYIAGLNNANDLIRTNTEPGFDITNTLPVATAAIDGWTIDNTSTLHLNTWSWEGLSDGTWMTPSFVENWVAKGSLLPEGTISYTIKNLVPGQAYNVSAYIRAYNEGSLATPEGAYFYAGDAQSNDISYGEAFDYNGMAGVYGTFTAQNAIADAEGNLTIGLVEKNNNFNWIAIRDIKVTVATVSTSIIKEAFLVDAEENQYQLNTETAISMEKQSLMIVNFDEVADVNSATYSIQAIVGYDEESGLPILGVPTWGEFSIVGYGYATQDYTYNKGVQYIITIEAVLQDGVTTETVQYLVDGTYEAEAMPTTISGEGTTLRLDYAVGTDLGDNYSVNPYILDADEQQIDINSYLIDCTTGGDWDPLNSIIITLNATLADGQYTVVLPANMFIVNGGDNNTEWRYQFTVSNAIITTISNIADSKKATDGKFIKNGKIVIVKNGQQYNVVGLKM